MPDIDHDEWEEDPESLTADERLSKLRMATLVKQYLQAQSLDVLVENGMEDAVMRFVDKDDKDAIKEWVLFSYILHLFWLTRASFVADTLRMVGRKMKEKEVKEDDVDLAVSDPYFHCTVCLADCAIIRWADGRSKSEVSLTLWNSILERINQLMVVTSREYNRYADSNPVPPQVCTLTVSFGDYADP